MTTDNVHLLFQRNLQFNLEQQLGQFDIGLFKEEKYRFEELQDWLSKTNNQELGINYLEWSSWFNAYFHFIGQGQVPETASEIPYPSFKKALEYMGFMVHRQDLEGNIVDKDSHKLQAQKFDLEAYMRDGSYVVFENAYRASLIRYSKYFIREKIFGEPVEADRKSVV